MDDGTQRMAGAPPPASPGEAPARFDGLTVVRPLGRGMTGEVFEARDDRTGERLVVKRLRASVTDLVDLVRFEREASIMTRLRHPNLMPIVRVEARAQPPWFAMPFREGVTVADRIARGRLEAGDAVPIARDAASALAECHRLGIVHRDVKPRNLLLESGGRTVLFDFGLAKDVTGAKELALTAAGSVMGTPAYMAPEQCRGDPVTAAVDVYALGVTVIEMLLGQNPFAAHDVPETLRRHLVEVPRRLDALLPGRVGPELGELVHRMIQKEAKQRPAAQRCHDVLAAIAARPERVPTKRVPRREK